MITVKMSVKDEDRVTKAVKDVCPDAKCGWTFSVPSYFVISVDEGHEVLIEQAVERALGSSE